MIPFINAILLTMLAVVSVAIIFQRSLFGVVVLTGAYSFLMASVFMVLDAVDVAMTEASVGAGISTVLLLGTLHLIKTTEMRQSNVKIIPILVVVVTGAVIVWGTLVLPPFGVSDAVIHTHVGAKYIADSIKETGVPNVVTAVLADYRGYDTLGEVVVIFTAGIGVMMLLRRSRARGDEKSEEPDRENDLA